MALLWYHGRCQLFYYNPEQQAMTRKGPLFRAQWAFPVSATG